LHRSSAIEFDPAMIARYDGRGPRYTSYPTADRFGDDFTADDYVRALRMRDDVRPAQPLSLYVHLPFCSTICFCCGCNKIVTRDDRLCRRARLQSHLGRHPGFRPGGAARRQPHSVRGGNADRDRRRARTWLHVGQCRPDPWPAETDARGFLRDAGQGHLASPDRIALYGYAHVPHLFKPQRRIAIDELPSADAKLGILALAIDKLGAAGYAYIGMDHFARPDDALAVAQRQRKLHRNFQGYSTQPDCDLIALGISAIGKVGATYVQNIKSLDAYYERLDARMLPVTRGIALDSDDVLRRSVIQSLMCHFELDYGVIESMHGIRFFEYFGEELAALAPLAADDLLDIGERAITVTPRGRLLVRAIAMRFDRRLREGSTHARNSKVI
jgi:coproporphyrinogen III oxidase-like Fe-S oxidoreductase